MMYRFKPLLLWFVTIGLCVPSYGLIAAAGEIISSEPGTLKELEPDYTVILPKLDYWPDCVAPGSLHYAQPLCLDDDTYTYFAILDGILRSGDIGLAALCIIDSSVVRSQGECSPSGSVNEMGYFPEAAHFDLIFQLAQTWRDLRVFERTDQLYELAYAVLERTGHPRQWKMMVLWNWASLKVARGQMERARELAARHTAFAREAFACDIGSSPELKSALKFEARILERAGDPDGAKIARKEAKSLPPPPPLEPCDTPNCLSQGVLRDCDE